MMSAAARKKYPATMDTIPAVKIFHLNLCVEGFSMFCRHSRKLIVHHTCGTDVNSPRDCPVRRARR